MWIKKCKLGKQCTQDFSEINSMFLEPLLYFEDFTSVLKFIYILIAAKWSTTYVELGGKAQKAGNGKTSSEVNHTVTNIISNTVTFLHGKRNLKSITITIWISKFHFSNQIKLPTFWTYKISNWDECIIILDEFLGNFPANSQKQ